MPTTDNILAVRNLGVVYGSDERNIRALDGIDLEIHANEVVGILGESGSGKSTLANAILGLLPRHAKCDSGEIFFNGRDLLGLTERELRRVRGRQISLVPQDPAIALNPVITVGNQISEVLRAHLKLSANDRRHRVNDLLCEVGFDQPADIYRAYPHQLSGGQRQRIVIVQALACRPSLIIADEPTSKLDAPLRTDIAGLLEKIRDQYKVAILVITHDPALLAGFADRIAVMYAGRMVEFGNCTEMFSRPRHAYTQSLMRLATSSVMSAEGMKSRFPAMQGELLPYGN